MLVKSKRYVSNLNRNQNYSKKSVQLRHAFYLLKCYKYQRKLIIEPKISFFMLSSILTKW